MATTEKSPQELLKALRRKQEKHEELVVKVEKTTARLEKRKTKLQTLESRIAEIEECLAAPRDPEDPSPGKRALKKAQLIFNPGSGKDPNNNGARLAEVVKALRTHGIDPRIGIKTSGKAARSLARKAVRNKAELIVVVAGDGTIEEVASELVGTSTVLAIVPIGTNNNVARCLGVPADIDGACTLIGMGTTRHIDVGRVSSSEGSSAEHFVEGAGVGLSAAAALAGQAIEKHRWHAMPRALRKFMEAKPRTMQIQLDDTLLEASSRLVTVSNAPMMGNHLIVAPEAKMDDGLLDVIVYDGMGESDLVRHFAAAKGGSDPLKTYHARHVRITADEPVPINADKDVTGQRRVVDIEIIPRAISVIVGNGAALTVPVGAAPAAPPLAGDPAPNGAHHAASPQPTRP